MTDLATIAAELQKRQSAWTIADWANVAEELLARVRELEAENALLKEAMARMTEEQR